MHDRSTSYLSELVELFDQLVVHLASLFIAITLQHHDHELEFELEAIAC